ncbi:MULTISPECIES: TspO/MBR family protein [unclassified Rhizobium]|uniref:TspO/MBR family protein n=1 Tax=unclassified Rhizobium TaxID=2613769 RepID=UPI002168DF05|nr:MULTISPECIES: TspO/MBR family protein [unclassified Rhizobium]MCS3744399.1 tryptophan-rich sensory protein [Rhizobium sp. BK661]MCS4096709.1 tryptophan-rich sensory protein [Rhizobium sp. BK176]
MRAENPDRGNFFADLALALLPVMVTSVAGQLATIPNIDGWYSTLTKPFFNPPNWIFAPVWTTLYVLMAFAAWRLLRVPHQVIGRGQALGLFFAQLALNGLWSWLFFAYRSPVAGLINIVPQLLLIVLTIAKSRSVDRMAAFSLVPLAVWVAFATVLNFEIWRLN